MAQLESRSLRRHGLSAESASITGFRPQRGAGPAGVVTSLSCIFTRPMPTPAGCVLALPGRMSCLFKRLDGPQLRSKLVLNDDLSMLSGRLDSLFGRELFDRS